jgi:hypothetical protein
VRGDWDAAIGAALEALDIAEAQAYHRPVVRTLMILTPIALARGRMDLMQRGSAWVERRRSTFPDSPFGRFMQGAMDLRFAAAGLLPPFVPGDDLLDAWNEQPGMPSWQAATWTNLMAWIDAGRLDTAATALERIAYWQQQAFATPLAEAVAGALGARLALARSDPVGAVAAADRGAQAARSMAAPWAIALAERARGRALSAAGRDVDAREAHASAGAAESALGLTAPLG